MAKMGRPKKVINQSQFEAMCQIQATQEEITLVLNVSDKTLNAWCKRTYGKTFSDIFHEKRSAGKISLRRKQWKLADRSAAMAIFLGQTDKTEMEVNTTVQSNPLEGVTTEELKKLIDKEG